VILTSPSFLHQRSRHGRRASTEPSGCSLLSVDVVPNAPDLFSPTQS
jgi:hypothetical protein